MPPSLVETLDGLGRPRICVVGDLILDTYVWGQVSRVSPEGPIPVLHVAERENRPGGAASVAAMLAGLGAHVVPVGGVGRDSAADTLRALLRKAGMDTDGLIESPHRPTIAKTRMLGYVQSAGRAMQQMLRVDEEVTDPPGEEESAAVLRTTRERLADCELLIIQDMGKGLFDDGTVGELIEAAHAAAKPVVVDPERTQSYGRYAGVTALLPNRFEAEMATGMKLRSEEDYRRAGRKLLDELSLQVVVMKLDREGMYFATAEGETGHIGARLREVADVTGAGDMVAAVFSLALAGGASYAQAAELANFGGALEVSHRGVTTISRRELMAEVQKVADPLARKLVPREEVEDLVADLRRAGRTIAFTNGCFDLLHLGHVQLLQYAARQGDVLMVGVNTDASTRALKGPTRPINSEQVRAHIVASLTDVDYVVLFEEESVLPLIRQVRPDVLVKGGDYSKEQVVGCEFVESYGGKVELAPVAEGFSTTELIKRIAENHGNQD